LKSISRNWTISTGKPKFTALVILRQKQQIMWLGLKFCKTAVPTSKW